MNILSVLSMWSFGQAQLRGKKCAECGAFVGGQRFIGWRKQTPNEYRLLDGTPLCSRCMTDEDWEWRDWPSWKKEGYESREDYDDMLDSRYGDISTEVLVEAYARKVGLENGREEEE